MARQLTQREKRILVLGLLAAAAIVALSFGLKGLDRWEAARTSLKSARAKLDDVVIDETKQAGLLSIVPVLEMPQPEEKQKFLFRERLHEQLKKAGVKTEPLTILSSRRKAGISYRIMRIRCTGKCKFEQLLDFLAALPENPYLVGVEELRVDCDATKPPDQRQDVDIDLTVSTFVQLPKAERAK